MARLYANENFPFPAVEELRRLGHDVLTTHESGLGGRAVADEFVLAFARSTDRILVTLNRQHVVRLHHEHPDHAGIIACTVDPEFVQLGRRIDTMLAETPSLAGRLIRINQPA